MSTKTESATAKSDGATNSNKSAARRVASVAHEFIDDTAAKADVVEQHLRESATKAADKVDASQEVASEQLDRTIRQVEGFVKGRPITSAGIAFAAGVLATAILRR